MTVLAAPRKCVVALVPTSRIWAIVCLALAIPMVAVTIALANDKTQTVVIIAGEAIAYAGIMLLALRRGIADPPEPIAVSRAELPPVMTIGGRSASTAACWRSATRASRTGAWRSTLSPCSA